MIRPIRTALAASLAAGFALATPAAAQEERPMTDMSADVNRDGMISFPEAQSLVPRLTAEDFTYLDDSGDGLLEASEIKAAVEEGALPPDPDA